jgi:hypothetical protein
VIAEVIARPIASVLFHGVPLYGPDMLGHFNKRSQFDRPLRKNAAIDEELAELDARMLRPQRNIVAQRRRKVRSRARRSIGGKTDTFGIPACSTRANRASLNPTPAELAPLRNRRSRRAVPEQGA